MRRRKPDDTPKEKILDVDATMQGTLTFRDPVNLRINGSFEGTLDTKGNLTIGEQAVVRANIKGEEIVVAGRVYGDIAAERQLSLLPPASVTGNITTPRLRVVEGAFLDGECRMQNTQGDQKTSPKKLLSADELARYLEVDPSMIFEWANNGKLPGIKDNNNWKFDREQVDEWVASGKVK